MGTQKREIQETLFFLPYMKGIEMTKAIHPKCVSTNYDIKDPLLFPHIIATSLLHHRCITMPLLKESSKTQEYTSMHQEKLFI